MSKQTTHTVVMVEPTRFGFNEEAAETNSFQNKPDPSEQNLIQQGALNEFREFVEQLRAKEVNVVVFPDEENSTTPDSIFPNNWFSTHRSGDFLTYPMAVSNRRKERRKKIIDGLTTVHGYRVIDFARYEEQEQYLEGTGSLIFDHDSRFVYAAESPRTHPDLVQKVAKTLGYSPVLFKAYGKERELIYHTNVMMCVGRTFVAIGMNTLAEEDKKQVRYAIRKSGKELIELNNEQVYNSFAGNMLQVENTAGESVLVLSETAYDSFTQEQLFLFNSHNDHIVPVSIPTIERIGGGSARCMLAELFLPD